MRTLLVVLLTLLLSGCVQPEGVKVDAPVKVEAPKVNVQPDAVKVGEGSQATFSVDSIWKMLNDMKFTLLGIQDIVSGIQAKVDSQVHQSVTVTQNKGSTLTYALGGAGVGIIGLLLFHLRTLARPRVPAKLARKVGGLLSVAVEKAQHDSAIRDLIGELAPKLGVTEAEIQRFRELVGTAPKPGRAS